MSKVLTFDGYPLRWPEGWARCPAEQRERSQYKVSFARARTDVQRSLHLLRASELVISSNVPLRNDGLPYANAREPEDPGVAVYWISYVEGRLEQCVVACDSWRTVRDNLRAIGLMLDGMRQIERAKASQILDRAFQGFKALPSGDPVQRPWRLVFGLHVAASPSKAWVEATYRELARYRHPDAPGGSNEKMAELNRAKEEALAELFANQL